MEAPKTDKSKDIKVKSLYKALLLLDHFCESPHDMTVTELAKKSGMLMSSVHNILSTFSIYGFIQKSPSSGKYTLGKKFLELANSYNRRNPAQSVLKHAIQRLSDLTGETVFLAVPYGINIIYLNSIIPQNSTNAGNIAGVTAPMYCTSIGKAILCKSSDSLITEVLNTPKKVFTENTITDTELLKQEIDRTRNQGYAIDNMEHEYGIKCVGIAVCLNNQLYGLSISGPSLRFSDEKVKYYAKLLSETALSLY